MRRIKHFIRWGWVYAIPLGLLGIALSLGIFFSGVWLTLLLAAEWPVILAWYCIMIVLLSLCVLLAAGCIQAIMKMVKLYRERYM